MIYDAMQQLSCLDRPPEPMIEHRLNYVSCPGFAASSTPASWNDSPPAADSGQMPSHRMAYWEWNGTGNPDHPLNKGVRGDFEAACALGLLRPEAKDSGVLFWLGLCQVLMTNLVERPFSTTEAKRRIADMLMLGLSGLGVAEDRDVTVILDPAHLAVVGNIREQQILADRAPCRAFQPQPAGP